jgi:mono/diheme cytochrome c family protein
MHRPLRDDHHQERQMKKNWTLIVGCMLLVGTMATASDQRSPADAPSETKATEQSHPVDSTSGRDAANTRLASPNATPRSEAPQAGGSADSLYMVSDGNKVDAQTLAGWKTWRALACERCHGAAQEGLVGPALVDSLQVLTKEEFHTTIMNGRIERGMPSFSSSKTVTDNWEGLYAYLKGRSDGRILPGRLSPLDDK